MNRVSSLLCGLSWLLVVGSVVGDAAINVRERFSLPLYVNIPVSVAKLSPFVPSPLVVDEYNGVGWISLLIYDSDKLEVYTPILGFVNSGTKGYATKVNLAVFDPVNNAHGYMITALDFQNDATGLIRQLGTLAQQQIPSHLCSYNFNLVNNSNVHDSINITYDCDFLDESHPHNGSLSGSASLIHYLNNRDVSDPAGIIRPDVDFGFMSFIVNRTTKYVHQFNGDIQYSSEVGPGSFVEFNDWSVLYNPTISTSIALERFGLDLPATQSGTLCAQFAGQCFLQPTTTFVDHSNTLLA